MRAVNNRSAEFVQMHFLPAFGLYTRPFFDQAARVSGGKAETLEDQRHSPKALTGTGGARQQCLDLRHDAPLLGQG